MRRMLMWACDGGFSSQAGGKQCGTKEECKKKVRQVVMQLAMATSPEERIDAARKSDVRAKLEAQDAFGEINVNTEAASTDLVAKMQDEVDRAEMSMDGCAPSHSPRPHTRAPLGRRGVRQHADPP